MTPSQLGYFGGLFTPEGIPRAQFHAMRMFSLLKGREVLASRDDWFRPVYAARGPDGGLVRVRKARKVAR